MKHIEIIVPCYNEEKCIEPFYDAIREVMNDLHGSYSFSILFVDDGSSDCTMNEIRKLERKHGSDKIRYISFSRNFGKESALFAGMKNCKGDYIVVMDADLQHPPTLIPRMLKAVEEEGYDCAGARRVNRKGEPIIRSFFSRNFYHFITWATGLKLVPGMTDFRLMRYSVTRAIAEMTETERFIKGIYSWVGFSTKWIEYENVERVAGASKWSFRGLISYAKSGFIAFATTPLRGVIYFGMLVVLVSFVYAVRLFILANTGGREWDNSLTAILLILFLGGVIITILGVIGEYLARIYMEVKDRPIYIAKDSNIGSGADSDDREDGDGRK